MKTATTLQENCEDIYADAKQINEDREAAKAEYEDASNALEEEGGAE